MKPPTRGSYIVNGVVTSIPIGFLSLILVGAIVATSEQISYWRAQ